MNNVVDKKWYIDLHWKDLGSCIVFPLLAKEGENGKIY